MKTFQDYKNVYGAQCSVCGKDTRTIGTITEEHFIKCIYCDFGIIINVASDRIDAFLLRSKAVKDLIILIPNENSLLLRFSKTLSKEFFLTQPIQNYFLNPDDIMPALIKDKPEVEKFLILNDNR